MWRATCLHADTYEEVEADRSSLVQASIVVSMASFASVLGAWLRTATGHPLPENALPLPLHLLILALEPFVTWTVGSVFAYMVGATFFKASPPGCCSRWPGCRRRRSGWAHWSSAGSGSWWPRWWRYGRPSTSRPCAPSARSVWRSS